MEQIDKQKIQEENDKKKRFLKSYLESVRRLAEGREICRDMWQSLTGLSGS